MSNRLQVQDNTVMTTQELANYLKLNEKTIIKMAQANKLPGVKIGNQWRFQLAAINSYLQSAIVRSSDEEIDAVMGLGLDIMPLSRLTGFDFINLDIDSKTASEVLGKLVKIATQTGLCPAGEVLFEELKKREEMLSTAMGNGIALPHPRHPSDDLFKEPKLIILRSKQGVDFKAPDDKPVHLFLMICAHNEATHIRLLAKVAKLFHAKDILQQLLLAKDKEEIIQILLAFERDLMFAENKSSSNSEQLQNEKQ